MARFDAKRFLNFTAAMIQRFLVIALTLCLVLARDPKAKRLDGHRPLWGERPWTDIARGSVAAKQGYCRDTLPKCKEKGSWLFLPGGQNKCRYPAAELCRRTCGDCGEVEFASRCQSSLDTGTPAAFQNGTVDWGAFFARMLERHAGKLLSDKPWLAEFPNFLSSREADLLTSVAERFGFEPEDMPKDTRDVDKIDCESDDCLADPFVSEIYRRVSSLLDIPMSNYESLEFLRYGKGQHYVVHDDATDFDEDDTGETVRGGLRILTVFFYLSDVEEGGETVFPNAKPERITVTPTKGSMIVWANTQNTIFRRTRRYAQHVALPVKRGIKYGANFWVHPVNYRIAEMFAGPLCRRVEERDDHD